MIKFLLLFLCLSMSAFAEDIILSWTPKTDPTLVGYRIYYGVRSKEYTTTVTVDKTVTTVRLNGFDYSKSPTGKYYFAITAYYTNQDWPLPNGWETQKSNEVVFPKPQTLPPTAWPPKLKSLQL